MAKVTYRRPSNNAASRAGSTIQTQRYNDDGSLSVINEPYTKPTAYTQNPNNTTQGIATQDDGTISNNDWGNFFKKNSTYYTPPNAASIQTPSAPVIPPPSNNGFSFGATSFPATPPATPIVPMTAADHINAAVAKGQAAVTAMGLPPVAAPARSFGSPTATTISGISGAPRVGDNITSMYGTGSVTNAAGAAQNTVNATQRLQKLAAPDYSDIGIYG